MPVDLPHVISRYLEISQAGDPAEASALASCFTQDAQVTDEGETRRGQDAIRKWWEGPANVYDYTVEILGVHSTDPERYLVFTRLTGNFPGGTAELANRFWVRDGLISRLEIAPPRRGEKPDAPAQV
jgi:hypothetical protein